MSASPSLFAAPVADKPANIIAAAKALLPHLGRSRILDKRLISNTMELCFNGTDAEGAWSWRDAYDAVEAAIVLQIRRLAPQVGRVEDAPAQIAALLAGLTDLAPTHSRRSEEQVALDQFSTPPALGALAVAAAQIRPGDRVLEPSAGTGLLAVIAEACGATVHLNEISGHRAAMLDSLFSTAERTRHDGAHLPNLLKSAGSFHAAVTNPPFQHLEDHLTATLRALADNGRMAAIVPIRLLGDRPALAKLQRHGEILAAISFPDRAYAKHGTSVETGLLVIDRRADAPSWSGAVTHCETLAEASAAVTAIRPRANAQARTFRDVSAASLLQPRARGLTGPSKKFEFLATAAPLAYEVCDWAGQGHDVGLYQAYRLGRVAIPPSQQHPSELVESGPMASVALPAPTYRPVLPPSLVESGTLSDAQLEVGIYAGEAHSRMLPGWWRRGEADHDLVLVPEETEGAFQLRQGFFLGDGTGCGKGRQLAAVMADNMAQGRKLHVWISKNEPLIEDARRDWKSIGGSPSDIVPLSGWKLGEKIRIESGIIFVTYATLRQGARAGKKSRLDQLLEALGEDFDGVIGFDEAHAMAKAIGGEGSRGLTKPSLQGQAGLALQNRLPKARVMYVSATGATTPENLAYASRLGLWGGPEAPFNTREDFLKAVSEGGTAVMELVARELKAMGLYIARSLSFEGVEYEPLKHQLTAQDVEIWNEWADAYQLIHNNLKAALEATGVTDEGKARSGQAKSAIISAFEGSKLRFFQALLSGIKAPTVIREIKEGVLDKGMSAICQIVSTNEAVMERRLADIPPEEWNNLSIDMTPKEYVLDYLRGAFPIQAWKVVVDDEGNETIEPLRDENGAQVVSQEALALRDDLIERLACLPAVPCVLDAIIEGLGAEDVAEITGRSRRVVVRNGRRILERRSAHAAKSETDAFMSGAKRVLVFSDAGGTGRSYHADKNVVNTQRRIHLLIEAGWRADAAIQGLGRSHRTNQAVAPLFRPVTTDIQGEKRFISTISRRLDSLGALTKGDRKTAGNGLFSAADNLESEWAMQALGIFYSNLVWGSASCMTADEFQEKTGITLYDGEGSAKSSDELPPINTWLNRVLALRIEDQNRIFEDFQAILDSILERAAESGNLDRGIEDIAAEDVQLVDEEVIRRDAVTGAETKLITFDIRTRREVMSADAAIEWAPMSSSGFFINERTGEAAIAQRGVTITDTDDRLIKGVRLFRPLKREVMPADQFKECAWAKADEGDWRRAWTAEVLRTEPWITRRIGLVTGLLLPIWKKIPGHHTLVRRLKAPDGRRWLGREIDAASIPNLRLQLGLSDVAQITSDATDVLSMVMDSHAEVLLAENLWLRRATFMGRPRLEVVNGAAERAGLKALGCFVEIANFTPRVFVPVDRPDVLASVLKRWPAVRIDARGTAA
jgi:protein-L-isoaspartate O-methyltransferase